jgi:hypothetical protein
MIINGFCKEVFQQLPMEFAVEATKLLGSSSKAASDDHARCTVFLEVRGLAASIAGVRILKGVISRCAPAKCTPSWAPTDRARARFAKVLAGHPAYEVTGGTVLFEARICSRWSRGACPRRALPRLSSTRSKYPG